MGPWERADDRPHRHRRLGDPRVAGITSGLLIEHRSGAAGALEWALRTLVVIAAPVALIATLALLLRLRRRGPRPAGGPPRAPPRSPS